MEHHGASIQSNKELGFVRFHLLDLCSIISIIIKQDFLFQCKLQISNQKSRRVKIVKEDHLRFACLKLASAKSYRPKMDGIYRIILRGWHMF